MRAHLTCEGSGSCTSTRFQDRLPIGSSPPPPSKNSLLAAFSSCSCRFTARVASPFFNPPSVAALSPRRTAPASPPEAASPPPSPPQVLSPTSSGSGLASFPAGASPTSPSAPHVWWHFRPALVPSPHSLSLVDKPVVSSRLVSRPPASSPGDPSLAGDELVPASSWPWPCLWLLAGSLFVKEEDHIPLGDVPHTPGEMRRRSESLQMLRTFYQMSTHACARTRREQAAPHKRMPPQRWPSASDDSDPNISQAHGQVQTGRQTDRLIRATGRWKICTGTRRNE